LSTNKTLDEELIREYDEILLSKGLPKEPPIEPHIVYVNDSYTEDQELDISSLTFEGDIRDIPQEDRIIIEEEAKGTPEFLFPEHSVEAIWESLTKEQRTDLTIDLNSARHFSTYKAYLEIFKPYDPFLKGVSGLIKRKAINTGLLVHHAEKAADEHLMNSITQTGSARESSLEGHADLTMNESIFAYRLYNLDPVKSVLYLAGVRDLKIENDYITDTVH